MLHEELIIISDNSVYDFFTQYHGDEFSKSIDRFVYEFFELHRHVIDKVYMPPKIYRDLYNNLDSEEEIGYKSEQQIHFEEIFEESKVISINERYDIPKNLNDIYEFHRDDVLYSSKEKKVIVLTKNANTEGFNQFPHFMNFEEFFKYVTTEIPSFETHIKNKFFPVENLP